MTNGGQVAAEHVENPGVNEVLWKPEVPAASGSYFFVQVTADDQLDDDGPQQITVTAPIWVGP